MQQVGNDKYFCWIFFRVVLFFFFFSCVVLLVDHSIILKRIYQQKYYFLQIGSVPVRKTSSTRQGLNTSVFLCTRDTKNTFPELAVIKELSKVTKHKTMVTYIVDTKLY